MRKTILLLVTILCALAQPYSSKAQFTWQWAVSPKTSATGTAAAYPAESFFTTLDQQGNVFQVAIFGGPDTVTFGSIPIINQSTWTMVITKTDSMGNYLWATGTQQTYSTSISASIEPLSLTTDNAGNVLVYGMYGGSSDLIFDTVTLLTTGYKNTYFLAKLSPTGRVLWAKNVAETSNNPYYTGGMGIDHIGNIYVSGNFTDSAFTVGSSTLINANPSGDSMDVFVIKYDASGNPVWANSFGGQGADWVTVMTVNQNGNSYITGKYQSDTMAAGSFSVTGSNNFLLKVNNTGSYIFAENLNKHIQIHGMTTDIIANEHLYMTGGIDSGIILGSDTLHYYGGDNIWYASGDVFTAKFDLLGNILWARSAGGDSGDVAWNLTLDTCGNVWIIGSIGGWAPPAPTGYTMNFDGHSLVLPSGSIFDPMFIAGYDNSGNYLNGTVFVSGGDDWAAIGTNNNGDFYVAGDYNGTIIAGTDTLTELATEYSFLAKYRNTTCLSSGTTTSIRYPGLLHDILVFPNPATEELTIQSQDVFPVNSQVSFYDITGRFISTYILAGTQMVIPVQKFVPGMYLCRITCGENTEVKKVMIMR